jgi:hypothetical protein
MCLRVLTRVKGREVLDIVAAAVRNLHVGVVPRHVEAHIALLTFS